MNRKETLTTIDVNIGAAVESRMHKDANYYFLLAITVGIRFLIENNDGE